MTSGIDQPQFFSQQVAPAPERWLHQFGTTVVIAPHPDDESLGCGGTLALLRQLNYPVHLVFVSDGSMSHPQSRQYPPDRLRQLREAEALDAAQLLGIAADAVQFMRLPDTQVPYPGSPAFDQAATDLATRLQAIAPHTLLLPWRRDPHVDHRASWHLAQQAATQLATPPRLVEYPVWLWELGAGTDLPQPGEVRAWSVEVESVLEEKQRAIAVHRSQVTHLIDDDPTGFYLSPDLLRYFQIPHEIFFIP